MLKNSKLDPRAYDSARQIRSTCVHANGSAESELPEVGYLVTERAAISKWLKHETTTLALACLNKMGRENRIADMKAVMRKAEWGFGEEALNQFWKGQAQAEGLYRGSCVQLSQSSVVSKDMPAEAAG